MSGAPGVAPLQGWRPGWQWPPQPQLLKQQHNQNHHQWRLWQQQQQYWQHWYDPQWQQHWRSQWQLPSPAAQHWHMQWQLESATLQQLVGAVLARLSDSGALSSFVDKRLSAGLGASQSAVFARPDRLLGLARLRFVKELASADDEEEGEPWVCPAAAQESLTGVLPVYALPPRPLSSPMAEPADVHAVEGTPELAAAAAALLRRAAQIRTALVPTLSPAQFTGLTQFHSHFDARTDELALDAALPPAEAAVVRQMEAALAPLVALAKAAVAAPLIRCAPARLHCPRRTWYARMQGGGQVEEVHQDVRGARYDGWHNVWLLLSETSHARPLVLLDPRGASPDQQSWQGERAFTFDGMRRGDAMVWTSNRVPHATATPLLRARSSGAVPHAATEIAVAPSSWDGAAQRSSFDFRCICGAE